MNTNFPKDSVTFAGLMRPSRVEAEIADLEIEGTLPPELNGAFYRVGPDNRFVPMLGDDIIVHGDGIVTMLRIRDGRAAFRSRYVRTDRFLAEEKAGRSLFGAYRNPYTDDPSVAGVDRGTANTNVVFHAGKLLVLKEDARPVEIDPETLETLGKWDAEGTITSPTVTAHPHPDFRTGELLMFGYQARGIGGTDVVFLPLKPEGRVPRETWFKAPYACLMHDFFATEHYALFPLMPAITFPDRVKQGAPYYMWDATQPNYIGVLPRNGNGEIRWFKGPARVAIHAINAWEEGERLILQVSITSPDAPPMFPPADGSAPPDWVVSDTLIVNWSLDLNGTDDQIVETIVLDDGAFIDFARIDPRLETSRHKQVWWVRKDPRHPAIDTPAVMASCNAIERYDHDTGTLDTYWTDDRWAPGEPIFVPRHPGSAEGDGFVIAPMFRMEGQGNAYMVFDALKIAEGPLATIHVPYHFRPAFHGNWVDGNAIVRAAEARSHPAG